MTMMGPGMAYGLGGLMLSLYVDINRMPEGEPQEHTDTSQLTVVLLGDRASRFKSHIPTDLRRAS